MKHISLVLAQLQKHQLFADPHKCEFGKLKIAYFSHIISAARDKTQLALTTQPEDYSTLNMVLQKFVAA